MAREREEKVAEEEKEKENEKENEKRREARVSYTSAQSYALSLSVRRRPTIAPSARLGDAKAHAFLARKDRGRDAHLDLLRAVRENWREGDGKGKERG